MKTIEKIMIFNAIISQIAVSFIFTFIDGIFLEISENIFIKIISSNIFEKKKEYENKSIIRRIRDITLYDPSQTNITIWTSILGAYFINKFGDLKVLFVSYLITIISIISILFLPYKETYKENYKNFSKLPLDFKLIIPNLLILITLSIFIGNYNLHSLQYIAYYFNNYKGFFIPFYIGIGCLIKYGFINIICLIYGNQNYENNDNYKIFLLFCIIFISFCFFISYFLTYKIENLIFILKSDNKENLKDLLIKIDEKDNFIDNIKILYFGEKSSELYYILFLNLLSKIEKIDCKYYNEKNLSKDDNKIKTKYFINCIFIVFSFFVGYIHDKYDFKGFKKFLNIGNYFNIIISIYFAIFMKIKGNNNYNAFNFFINYINLFFFGNYYAIMLPELMRKYGIKYIFELSGFIGLSNILSRLIEAFCTVYPYEEKKELFYGIMFFQIVSSVTGIILIYNKKITSKQHQELILNEIKHKRSISKIMKLSSFGVENINDDDI